MRYIIKLSTPRGDRYLEWSTIVDAPVTYGMPLDEFTAYYRDQYGAEGMRALPERMARVEAKGTSDRISRDVSGRGVQTALLKLMEETEVPLYSPNDMRSQLQMMFEMRKGEMPLICLIWPKPKYLKSPNSAPVARKGHSR